ncbi:DNA-binding SARP family transcriptional activator [Streptomyces aurantiacus]|nr:DNA-binding SARP family transcriptional activator [Streptomyces aurantiacus]
MDGVPRVPEQWRPEDSAALRFSVLGPVRAWRGAQALPTGSPQQRALLAALLLREGRTATAGELIDALWGDDPPSQALAAVRTYASRLRKILTPDVLVSESGGYAIRLSDAISTLDLVQAQELAAAAEKAKVAFDLCHARALLNEALDLWDGEALASVPGPYAETQRTRLQEWQLQLRESRLDMDLEQGCHAEAVSELTALTATHPLRERLRELLMLALYRSGRQAEALAAYADTRRLLADELGVDPGSDLQELQQRILQADPGLAKPSAPLVPESAATPVRPAQLPATVPDFTGRMSFVSELREVLATAEGRVMAVSALAGIGGVGKTTLAVHVAHQARGSFPDGQLYVDLQGAGARAAEPGAVLGAFLRALGTADTDIPDSLEERAALYRSTLDGRRILVLLDNARDAAQVRPLLPGTEGCAALVTSRARMVDLAGAHLVDLDVMSPEEALQLFTKIVGAERVASERESALDVVAACGFLPLAIRIAASRLAARRTWTVSVLAAKLADERRRLDELQAGDLAVKATFELGYGQLEPAQARAFRLLGLADGPDLSLAAAAAVLDLPAEETEDLLESLVDTSLLESAAPGRYRYHDLVRLYARACAERDEQPPGERGAAMSRLLDFYLATAAEVYAIERPGDRLVDHLATTDYPGLRFTEGSAALDWLYTEAAPLLACVRQSAGTALLRRAVDLLWAAKDLTESGANSHQYETTARAVCDATRAARDSRAEGRARTTLTNVLLVSGRIQQAAEQAQLAIGPRRDRRGRHGHELGGQRPRAHPHAPGAVRGQQAVLRAGHRGLRRDRQQAARSAQPVQPVACASRHGEHPDGRGDRAACPRDLPRDRPDPAPRQRSLHAGHRAVQGRPALRGAQPALRRPVRLQQPPAAALGGHHQLPDGGGAPGGPPARAGGPARRAGAGSRLHRRRPDAGRRPDAPGPGPHDAGAGGPGQGLLARGAQPP